MTHFESAVQALRSCLPEACQRRWARRLGPVYNRLLEGMYGRRGLLRRLNGSEIVRVRPAFRGALQEDAEPSVFRALRALAAPGMVVFDVGAGVGIFTMVLARWCGSGGRVVAFEPTPQSREALRDHLALNALADRVEIVEAAVSDYEGTGVLFAAGCSGENTLHPSYFRPDAAARVRVPVTTIDAYCRTSGLTPDLMKIDVEGLEFQALRGARETLLRCRPAMIVELHAPSWAALGESAERGEELARDLGYRVTPLDQERPFLYGGHVLLTPE